MKIDKQLFKSLALAIIFIVFYESSRFIEKPLDQAHIYSADFNRTLLSISNPIMNFVFSMSYYLFHPALIVLAFILLYKGKKELLWKSIKIYFLIGFLWISFSLLYPIAPPRFNANFPQIRLSAFPRGDTMVGLKYGSFPSFHIFSCFLASFLALRFFPSFYKPFLLISMYYSLVVLYLGEHYWFDVLAGFALSIVAFKLMTSESFKFKQKVK